MVISFWWKVLFNEGYSMLIKVRSDKCDHSLRDYVRSDFKLGESIDEPSTMFSRGCQYPPNRHRGWAFVKPFYDGVGFRCWVVFGLVVVFWLVELERLFWGMDVKRLFGLVGWFEVAGMVELAVSF